MSSSCSWLPFIRISLCVLAYPLFIAYIEWFMITAAHPQEPSPDAAALPGTFRLHQYCVQVNAQILTYMLLSMTQHDSVVQYSQLRLQQLTHYQDQQMGQTCPAQRLPFTERPEERKPPHPSPPFIDVIHPSAERSFVLSNQEEGEMMGKRFIYKVANK